MRRKNILLIILITLVATAMTSQITAATELTKVSVSPLPVTGVPINGTFNINITVADVNTLWGYQVEVKYNTTVLTATAFKNLANITYSPFNIPEASEINDTAGYVTVVYHAPMADAVGITTAADPKPLAEITFRVDANGTTKLDLDDIYTELADVRGNTIKSPYNMVITDGIFSNVGEIKLHDVAVTGVAVNATTAKPGNVISIDVTVKNNGDFDETFSVSTKYNVTATSFKTPPIGTKTITNLAKGTSSTISFTWNTAGVAEGKYFVRATATLDQDDRLSDNARDSDVIKLSKGGGGGLDFMLLIGGAIVVIVVVVAAVYLLRARKRS